MPQRPSLGIEIDEAAPEHAHALYRKYELDMRDDAAAMQ
jgi:glucarate dehydratase